MFMAGDCGGSRVEGVEVAPAARGQVHGAPVGDQRHTLLGNAAVRAQRHVEAGQIVPVGAGADHREPLRDDDDGRRRGRAAARSRARLLAGEDHLDPG